MMDENNLPELRRGWVWIKLKEIAKKINPGFPSGKHNREGKGIPHLRPMNINSKGEIDFSDVKYVQREDYDPLSEGDVLFNNTNSPELLGKTAYIKKDTNWAYSNHMTRIRLHKNIAYPGWVAYCLHYLFLTGYYRMNCIHHVNQASINVGVLSEKIPLPLPPLPEQQRIVVKIEELFTELDTGIEALKKVKTQLKRYRQAVLKYAFEGKLTEEWREIHREELEPASVLLERIKEERKKKAKRGYKELPPADVSELPELPEKWIWALADELSYKITDGEHITPKRTKKGVLLLSARNILDGKLSLHKVDYILESEYQRISKRLIIEPGDVLLSCSGTVGRSCVAPDNIRFSLVRSVAVIKVLFGMGHYISYSLRSLLLQRQIDEKKTQTAQANIFQNKIRQLIFSVAPVLEQQKIVEEIEQRFSVADEIEKTVRNTLKQAERLRQSILKRAFEGKLVPQNPDDEPASVLLERIKAEKAKKESKKTRKSKKQEKYKQKRLTNYDD